jgi:hypothetical protein
MYRVNAHKVDGREERVGWRGGEGRRGEGSGCVEKVCEGKGNIYNNSQV